MLLWNLQNITAPDVSPQVLQGDDYTTEQATVNRPGIAFSPDSTKLALVTSPPKEQPAKSRLKLRVWDLSAEDVANSLKVTEQPNPTVSGGPLAFDASSQWLVVGGHSTRAANDLPGKQTALLWDLSRPFDEPLLIPRINAVYQVVISHGGRWMFTSRYYTNEDEAGTNSQLWDLTDPRQPIPHPIHECEGEAADVSPNGKWLAASSHSSPTISLFDLEADDPVSTRRVLRGHTNPVWDLKFTGDSNWLVTCSSDGTVRRWCMDVEWLTDFTKRMAGRELTKVERTILKLDGAEH